MSLHTPLVHDAGTDHTVEISGLRLHVREWGRASAPPVVVLHGIMGHAREWDVLTAALAEHHRVFAVDQRGHGLSSWASGYGVDALAEDLVGLIVELGLRRVAVVGHSLGGLAALVAAAERPDLVSRLVMIDIGPESLTTDWARDELPAMLAGLAGATYAQPQDAVTEWLAGNPLAREPLMRHYVEHCLTPGPGGALRWRFDGHGLARQVATGIAPQERLWHAVDRVRIPTLLVRGEHSPLVAPDAADRVTHRLADGHRAEIRHGGHDLGVEQPEAVTEAVTAFLGPTSGVAG